MRGHREGEPHIHAARVVLDRACRETARPRRTRRSRRIGCGSRRAAFRGSRRSGRCSPGRSAPGWKPVPTSSSEPTRPRSSTSPLVGSVIRERIFRSVLLPAPFRPMIPDDLARGRCRSRRRGAPRRSSARPRPATMRLAMAAGHRAAPGVASRGIVSVRGRSTAEAVLLTEVASGARLRTSLHRRPSDDIREGPLHPPEIERPRQKKDQRHGRARDQDRARTEPLPRSAQRNPSTTPVMGLSPLSHTGRPAVRSASPTGGSSDR